MDESKDFCALVLVESTLVPVCSVLQGVLNTTDNNQETPDSSSGTDVSTLLPSTEFLSPQTLASASESHSASDRLFNRKTRLTVRRSAPLSVGKEVCSSSEDVQTQSSNDEVSESRPTSVERNSNRSQSGSCSFVRYFLMSEPCGRLLIR